MILACWILLLFATFGIAYQDFKNRLISIWLIVVFGIINSAFYILTNSLFQLLENALFCICYFLFIYLVLQLYYFAKTKSFQKIINEKIGWGDIWIGLLIGVAVTPEFLIFFFTGGFIVALLFHILFVMQQKSIALAAVLVICNAILIIYHQLARPF